MNAYEKSVQLGLAGTDAEKVAALRATGLTTRPINRAELIHLLNMRGMLRKIVGNNSDEKWTGTVLNMQDAILAGGTDEQKNGIRLWFSHVTNPSNQVWDTTQLIFASTFWQLYLVFKDQDNMPSTADFEAIAALGGGWLFVDLTEQQFGVDRDQYLQAQSAHQALEAIRGRRQAWDTLAAQIRSGIESGSLADSAAVLSAVSAGLEV